MQKIKSSFMRRRTRFISAAAIPAALLLAGSFARAASSDTTWTGGATGDTLDLSATANWSPDKPANGYLATINGSVTVPSTLYFENTATPATQSYGGILLNSSTLTTIDSEEQASTGATAVNIVLYGTTGGDVTNQPVLSLGANVNQNVSLSDSQNVTDAFEIAAPNAIMNVTNADATLTINSKVSSTTPLASVQKTGAGELALLGGNSFGNGTTVAVNVQDSAGTIAVAATSGLGVATTTFQFDGGALLFTNTASISVAHVMTVDSNGGEIDNNGSGTVTLTSALDGSGPLAKGGTSELYLSGTTSTYNGTITVNNGNLRLTAPGALAYQSTGPATNATVDLVGSGSTLNIRSNTATFNVNVVAPSNAVQIYSTTAGSATNQTITIGTIALGAQLNVNGSNGYILSAGTLTLTGTGTILTAGDSFITTGIAQSGGPAALVKTGANYMTVTGSSSYSGGTTVGVGTLTDSIAGVPGAFGSGSLSITPAGTGTLSTAPAEVIANSNTTIASTAAVTVNNSSFANGTLVFNSAAPTIGSLSGTGNVVLNGASGTALTTGTSGNPTFSGVISDNGSLTNNGSLTVTGSGTFTLAGTGTYFGSTNVSGGTLDITGALTNSGTVNVNNASNLVLAATGSVPVTAIVNVGASANVFVNNNQTLSTLANAGTTDFTAGTGTASTISGAGTVLVSSVAILDIAGSFGQGAVVSNGVINLSAGASNIVGQGSGLGTGAGGASTTGGISGTGTLSVNGTANLYAANITQSVLNIGATNTVTIADSAAPGNASSVSVLTDLNNSGTLDLNNNDLIVTDSTQYSTIKALIVNAADGGAWDQPGITSSSARANTSTYGLGYAPASAIGTTVFDGVTLAGTETIVKYTLLGDTQLRGAVGIGDYDTVLSNYGTGTDWSQGNFHYSGVVGIGDYDDVLSNYGVHPSGNLVAAPALTRSLSPALSVSPDAAKSDLKLEVNTTTGDVYLEATTSVAFAGYTISDPSAHLLAGSTSPDPAKLLSVAPGNGGNTNPYETGTTYINWFKISETSIQLSEGQNNNGFANHSSRDDTINIPAGGTIDFGDIYNTAVNNQDISFDFAEAGTTPTNGPAYYGAEVDYIGGVATPEPATLGLVGFAGVMMLRRRGRRQPRPISC